MPNQFRTDMGVDPKILMNIMTGKPTTPWGRKNAVQTRRLLANAGVPQFAIEAGAFDHIDPQTAAMWSMGHGEATDAYNKNEEGYQRAVRLLATQLGENVPQDLVDKYGAAPGTVQSRMDQLKQEVLNNTALAREGFISGEQQRIKEAAAQHGQPVTGRNMSNLANRAAVLFGRQAGQQIGSLNQSDLSRRERILGQISSMEANRTYEPTDYSALAQSAGSAGGSLGSFYNRKAKDNRTRYGISWGKRKQTGGGEGSGVAVSLATT